MAILDQISRVVTAADGGSVHYLWSKAGELAAAAGRLEQRLGGRDGVLDAERLRQLVRVHGRHYRAGRALYPEQATTAAVQVADGSTAAQPAAAEPRQEQWSAVVRALTAATRAGCDMGAFVASALAATAANVGGVDRVLSARSGSWEAHYVGQLVNGTVPDVVEELAWHRTEPVVVPLNVDQLLFSTAPAGGHEYARAVDALEARWRWEIGSDLCMCDDCREYGGELAELQRVWSSRYELYAAAFREAVAAEAARIEGLRVAVVVEAVTALDGMIKNPGNPDEFDCDPLVWRLWHAAVSTVPKPTGQDAPAGDLLVNGEGVVSDAE